ncbi:MAG: hypothetical protein GY754_37580, partial [bacterium]|nr:hypothetical protein [bacterium]
MRNNKKILNYIITEKIDETANSVVYRGRRDSAGAASSAETVIIKVLKIEHSTPSDIARFKQEYEIIKGLHFEGILETFDIIEYTEGMALVLE